MFRRQYLGALLYFVGGCAGVSPLSTPTPTRSPTPTPTPTPHLAPGAWATDTYTTETYSATLHVEGELGPHEYGSYSWTPQRTIEVEISVETGGGDEMDLLVMEGGEFDRLRDGKQAGMLADLTMFGVSDGSTSGSLTAGDYQIVFDNSTWGEAKPEGTIRFEAEVVSRIP